MTGSIEILENEVGCFFPEREDLVFAAGAFICGRR
jgi:hypothetical protein